MHIFRIYRKHLGVVRTKQGNNSHHPTYSTTPPLTAWLTLQKTCRLCARCKSSILKSAGRLVHSFLSGYIAVQIRIVFSCIRYFSCVHFILVLCIVNTRLVIILTIDPIKLATCHFLYVQFTFYSFARRII